MAIGPDTALEILRQGGFFLRRDERLTQRRCLRLMTRLYDKDGREIGVANYAKKKLLQTLKIKEIEKDKWVLK